MKQVDNLNLLSAHDWHDSEFANGFLVGDVRYV